ncbi:MAG: PEP-utilizing enzyme [Actinomycetota bacterium]
MKKALYVEHSVLLASLMCEATKPGSFKAATGMPGPIEEHHYEGSWHSVDDAAYDRMHEQYMALLAKYDQEFAIRAETASEELLRGVQFIVDPGPEACPPNELGDPADDWRIFRGMVLQVAPFAIAAQILRLPTDLVPDARFHREVTETRFELDDAYRLARQILRDPATLKVFKNTAPAVTLNNLRNTTIRYQIRHHIESYGWLRTRAYRLPPPTETEVVDRLQGMVMRWSEADLDVMIGDEREGGEERDIRRTLTGQILLQMECLGRPYFARLAEQLGCTLERILFSTADELTEALAGRAPLPVAAAGRRYGEGFSVYRTGDKIEVHTAGPQPFQQSLIVLKGLTACRGRVVGPVRIVRDVPDLDRLRTGDVLVSPASTTDWAAGPTVFPTRGGGPAAVGRAAAVVTDDGGLLSHAAVVCRERGIPAVLGTERATELLWDGMVVEVEATRQVAKVIVLDPAPPDGGLLA